MVKQKEDLDILDEVVSATLLKMAECRIEAIPDGCWFESSCRSHTNCYVFLTSGMYIIG